MLYLHVSNRTENLLTHLIQVLQISGQRDLFEKECFLIQSQGMERMISQTLASEFTSWCNFEYFLPLSFLKHTAELLGMEITPDGYERKVMAWRIEALLRDLDGEEYDLLRKYLDSPLPELKRFQLADQLANIFDQYQLMRPEMLAAWEEGRMVTGESSEYWQKQLWNRLAGQLGSTPHRGKVLLQVIERLSKATELSLLPSRVSVFGLSIMPPLFLAYLQSLAKHSDVHLYTLSPCMEYWGDIESRRSVLLRSLNCSGEDLGGLEEVPESHPLLVSLGRQGRDFQRMIFDVPFEMDFSSYEDPLDSGFETLLKRLQSDLLHGEVRPAQNDWPEDDNSIRIISCHSKLREITILREHILRLLHENEELELRDIIVMAPDIQEYGPLIPAIFDDIQHSISDRSLRRRNNVLATFEDFLNLFSGRFGWDDLLDLVKQPAIMDKLELSENDLESLHHWVIGSGIRWGLSGEQRKSGGLPDFSESSWRGGLDRLLMGYAIDSDEFIDGILPFVDIEGGGGAPLGALCQFVDLVEKGRRVFTKQYTLNEWSALLVELAEDLFLADPEQGGSREYMELHEILTSLGDEFSEFHNDPVDFTVIASWLQYTARETRSSSGFLRGQLTFCSMLPMRSIPFKVVCVIGLNDGVFPAQDRMATFDLMAVKRRPGDRSRRMDDRYQFLEALLAARDNLYLSYIGQSIRTNDEIPPSVVVTELLEVLEEQYRANHVVTNHPLHSFSKRYFNGKEPDLFSYDTMSCKLADRFLQPPDEQQLWWRSRLDDDVTELRVDDLLRYYRGPQAWFVRTSLGIRLESDFELVPRSELFEVDGLEKYLLDNDLLRQVVEEKADICGDTRYRQLISSGSWPLGTPGELGFEKTTKEIVRFAQTIEELEMGERLNSLEVDLNCYGCRIFGVLNNIYENGILLFRNATMKGKDLLGGWLHKLLYQQMTGKSIRVVVVGLDRSCTFSADSPAEPSLEFLVDEFKNGSRRPSSLYLEPGMKWVEQVLKEREGIEAAEKELLRSIENGYEPEIELLAGGADPGLLLDEAFEERCETILLPIVQSVEV